ncbi:hypothetical protein, partial [Herbaspirillum sp. LeCh32-8]|uniref:hypothetical protein n=1 Tax=Herbaspirillum sp. LeCh32-8 TaxID=2821356 RepID=UPI001AE2C81D
ATPHTPRKYFLKNKQNNLLPPLPRSTAIDCKLSTGKACSLKQTSKNQLQKQKSRPWRDGSYIHLRYRSLDYLTSRCQIDCVGNAWFRE